MKEHEKKEKIIDYLTVQVMSDKQFAGHHHNRARAAWLLAKKKYNILSKGEKGDIIREIIARGGV